MTQQDLARAVLKCNGVACSWQGPESALVPQEGSSSSPIHLNVCPECGSDDHVLDTPGRADEKALQHLRNTLENTIRALLTIDSRTTHDLASELEVATSFVNGLRLVDAESPASQQTAQPIILGGLMVEMTTEERDAFYRFCEAYSTVHGHGVSDAMLQRLTTIGLIRPTIGAAFEVTEFGVALNTARVGLPAMDWAVDPSNPNRTQTEEQTVKLLQRGFRISGYVLRGTAHEDACVIDYGSTRWLHQSELHGLLHAGPETHLTSADEQLSLVREAVHGYYGDLDARKHGGIAQSHAFQKIEAAIGERWIQGATLSKQPRTT